MTLDALHVSPPLLKTPQMLDMEVLALAYEWKIGSFDFLPHWQLWPTDRPAVVHPCGWTEHVRATLCGFCFDTPGVIVRLHGLKFARLLGRVMAWAMVMA